VRDMKCSFAVADRGERAAAGTGREPADRRARIRVVLAHTCREEVAAALASPPLVVPQRRKSPRGERLCNRTTNVPASQTPALSNRTSSTRLSIII
jgi:hypothetical protein